MSTEHDCEFCKHHLDDFEVGDVVKVGKDYWIKGTDQNYPWSPIRVITSGGYRFDSMLYTDYPDRTPVKVGSIDFS